MKHKVMPFQVKELKDSGEFAGYGSVFEVKDSYDEIVIKGAFAESLANWKTKGKLPPLLWQHDSQEPVGTHQVMHEDNHGLFLEGKLLLGAGPTEKRAYEHLKAGSIDGLSIGYSIPPGGIEYSRERKAYLLKQINLWEVSLVTFPANPEATVSEVKAAVAGGPREFERYLREAGLTRSQAKGLMARGYEGLSDLREADDESLAVLKQLSDHLARLRAER